METNCTFTVAEFTPVEWEPAIKTALGVGNATMVKQFTGGLAGRSITQFVYAYDDKSGVGTYVAMVIEADGTHTLRFDYEIG